MNQIKAILQVKKVLAKVLQAQVMKAQIETELTIIIQNQKATKLLKYMIQMGLHLTLQITFKVKIIAKQVLMKKKRNR